MTDDTATDIEPTTPTTSFATASRAVSITLNYILVLAIAALLVSGLMLAGGVFVEDQRERVIENELSVIGHHLAGDLEAVDRMVQAGGGDVERAEIDRSFQGSVTGTSYDITLEENPDRVVLTSTTPEVVVEVQVNVDTDIGHDTGELVDGGDMSVQYDPDEEHLVIIDG